MTMTAEEGLRGETLTMTEEEDLPEMIEIGKMTGENHGIEGANSCKECITSAV